MTTTYSTAAVLVPVAGAVGSRRRGGLDAMALLATATTWGLSLSHALQMPAKRAMSLDRWWSLARTLYRPWFGRAGHVEGVALVVVPLLALLERRRGAAVASAALLIANPLIFTTLVAPTNAATLGEEVPSPGRSSSAAGSVGVRASRPMRVPRRSVDSADGDDGAAMTPTVVPAAVEELITSLPKVELHVHLEGSMQPGLLLELADKHGVPGLPVTLEGLREWYEFRDFEHFITVYEAAVKTLRDEDDFARLVEQTAAGLAAQNVHYAEVILTPVIHIRRGVEADTIFAGVERGRLAAYDRYGIELRWIPDFAGHNGVAEGDATLDVVLAAGLDSVVGFSIGGIEVDREPFAALFTRARAAGLHSVPHAGEAGGPDRMWSAVHRLAAERIGHGVRCLDDPALVEHLAATGLPLDVCPTSNLRTRVVTDLASHPLPTMIDAGLVCTVNSDDPPMFGTDLTAEYRTASRMGLPSGVLVELARNAVRASFAETATKTGLLAAIDRVERDQTP